MEHEEEFLNSFFNNVSQLCFDKAKESVEKEREACRSPQMGPWGMLLMHLPQILVLERSYVDLGFLHTKNKSFLRKDNSLKSMYEALKGDLRRVEEMTQGTNVIGNTVAQVSNQLCQFITARIQLIEFYEKTYNMSISSKSMKYQDLLQLIEGIARSHSLSCSHLVLIAIKTALTLECEIQVELIKAQVEIQNWRFLPALMALYGAQARMSAWERTLQNRESWKLGFGATFLKANPLPALYTWLQKVRNAILAKFSLYFHSTLSQQASPGEMRSIMSKQNVDYYHKMQSFQRKYDVLTVLIVFDSRGIEQCGSGYRHPKRDPQTSENFPMVVSCPSMFMQKPSVHVENIRKAMQDNYSDLLVMDKMIHIKCQKDSSSYIMHNIDPTVTLVVAYENSKQRDRESYVTSFMSDLCTQIRCNKVYECLKLSK